MYKLALAIVLMASLTAFLLTVYSKDDSARVTKKATAQESEKVRVLYSAADDQLVLHQPIILDFTVQNGLAQPIKLDLGHDCKAGFLFIVTRPDGTRVELPQLNRGGTGAIGRLSLKPGQTYKQKLLLNEWYEFTVPGKYEVEIRLANQIQTGEGANIAEDAAAHITLEIGSEDATQLERVCVALVKQITNATSYSEAAEAALALSYVKDPVAVSYLQRALMSGRMVEPIAIAGLERVGDKTAIQALISALKIETADTARMARSALGMIERKSQDQVLKEHIRRAL